MNDDGPQTTLHQATHDDSQPRGRDRVRRRPLGWWDRVKFILLAGGAWLFLAWREVLRIQQKDVSSEEISQVLGISDSRAQSLIENLPDLTLALQFDIAADIALKAYGWLLVIAGVEAVRQLHYFVSERSAAYHRFWTEGVFGGFNARTERMNDWNRYRLSRVLKWLFWAFVASIVLSQIYETHPLLGIFQAPVALFQAMPFVVQLAFFSLIIVVQFVALFWFLSRGGTEVYFPEDIETRFRDVWGQDHVLDKVKENIIFLEDPESIEEKGGYLPGGILLWGPPGTGKTLMAEAVAGETGKPFVFVEPSAFINMFLGVGALKVKSLFRKLRKLALRYGGVIVFFDEADSLGSRGSVVSGRGGFEPGMRHAHEWSADPPCNGFSYLSAGTRHLLLDKALRSSGQQDPGGADRFVVGAGMGGGGGGMGTLQALLTEMSGLKKPRGFWNRIVRKAFGMRPKPPPKYRILIMMASNMPQALDPALLRPGRIDRIYHVGYPSKDGRKRTYEGYLAKIRHNLTEDDIDKLATQTPYATGASIKDLVNESLIQSISEGRKYVTWQDIIKARLLQSIGPPEAVEYGDRERHSVAIHEACHAVAAYRVSHHRAIDIATIEKSQTALGMVKHIPREERFTKWKNEYDADLVVALAALAGERVFYGGDSASGVSGDLASSTGLALEMEAFWGMGETLGSQAVSMGTGTQIQDTSRDIFETELGRRAERRLVRSLERATQIIEENRYEVLAVAHALEVNKTITGDDVAAVIEGRVGPLLDGRPYRGAEFRAMVDEYHDKALRVHQEHAQVEVPVPRLEAAGVGAAREAAPGFTQGLENQRDRPL